MTATSSTSARAETMVTPLSTLEDQPYGRLDRALGRWLVLLRRHPLGVHGTVAAGIAGAIDLLIVATHPHVPSALDAVGTELAVVSISVAIPLLLTGVALRGSLRAIFALISNGPSSASPVLLRFVGEEVSQLQEVVEDLRTDGLIVAQASTSEWVQRRCFLVAKGRYIASDSCVPSVFLSRYSELMIAHASFCSRTGSGNSIRINVSDDAALETDRTASPDAYRQYMDWHVAHRIALLHIDAATASTLAETTRLRKVTDWSLWVDELALSWTYEGPGVRLRMSFGGDVQYKRCYRFMQSLIEHALPMPPL